MHTPAQYGYIGGMVIDRPPWYNDALVEMGLSVTERLAAYPSLERIEGPVVELVYERDGKPRFAYVVTFQREGGSSGEVYQEIYIFEQQVPSTELVALLTELQQHNV